MKFDFTSPASENGYCGYAGISLFGKATVLPPVLLGASLIPGAGKFVINVAGLYVGQHYTLQSSTNLMIAAWLPETSFTATQSSISLTNSTFDATQKFFRIAAFYPISCRLQIYYAQPLAAKVP